MPISEREKNKVILATPPTVSHRTAEENLGIGYLAAILRKNNYEVDIIDGWLEGFSVSEMGEKILLGQKPLFLGFSVYPSNLSQALKVIEYLKMRNFGGPFVAGGYGPTFHQTEFLKAGFDVILRGEAEGSIKKLADHYVNGYPRLSEIPGIGYIEGDREIIIPNSPSKTDIETLPFPSRDTLPLVLKRKTPVHISSSRGCEGHCLFCSIVTFQRLSKNPQWRQRSIQNFVDELEYLINMGAYFFKVVDDSFIEPPRDEKWTCELADEINRRSLTVLLRGSIRADRVSEGVLQNLKDAGFVSFSCGIENFSPSALKRMAKTATVDRNLETLELFKKLGIIMQQGMILFDYRTTLDEIEENYQGMRKYDHTVIKGVFTEMYAAEGTPLTKLLSQRSLLLRDQLFLGNYRYLIQDERARIAYFALKAWHRSHSRIYDMAIDPLSAPKALNRVEMAMFLPLARSIRYRDLDFMRDVLDRVSEGRSEQEIMQFTQEEIERTIHWYDQFRIQVEQAYKVAGLVYDAEENPFVC
ncbi:cobalamin B12-binding domain-containing protein [Candidatus Daviesbacteria bacterium]|nr:cobalamin B12-binding domain-containing protein [Candidatus Daviesbacteria bacterium]